MRIEEVAARRMRNSGLLTARFDAPEDVVAWHGAMQAQDWGPAKWSIGQRAKGLVDADVDAALAAGSIMRTHVLRPTWHVMARDDARWILALTGPRIQRGIEPRYGRLGLDPKTRARCERVVTRELERNGPMTREELGAALHRAKVDPEGQRLPHALMHCELEALICSGGLRGKQQTFALFDERVPAAKRPFDRDAALVELVCRYVRSHGPATPHDLAWWSSLTVADIKRALHDLGDEVSNETVDGLDLWTSAKEQRGAPSPRGVHLLQAYDETIVGYRPSRYAGDPRAADAKAAWLDRDTPSGVVLSNGRLAGQWRRRTGSRGVGVEFHPYKGVRLATRELESAARRLGRFAGLPATVSVPSR